jgi:Mg2+ and Co2+ transporter CorA
MHDTSQYNHNDEGQTSPVPSQIEPIFNLNLFNAEYPLHLTHIIPAPHTDIDDVLEHVNGKQFKDLCRVLCIGLNYECRVYDSLASLWSNMKEIYIKRREKSEEDVHLRSEPVWIDFQAPQQDDFVKIQQYFSLHPLTTEDCMFEETREKWEEFEDYIYVVMKVPVDYNAAKEDAPEITNLNVIVFDDYVITIHAHPIQGIDLALRRIGAEFELETARIPRNLSSVFEHKYDLTRVRAHHPSNIPKIKKTTFPGTDWILYALIDAIIDLCLPQVDAFVRESETLDELVFVFDKSDHSEVMDRLNNTKKNAILLRRALLPKQRLVHRLMSSTKVSKTTQIYARDILDHISISVDRIESCKEGLNHTHSNYMMKVQIDVKKSAKRTIVFLSRMSMIVAVLMPSNLVSSLWGMNCWVPWRNTNDPAVFVGILAGMFILSMLTLIYLRGALNFQRDTYD